jgi:hypothetical protein
MIEKILVALKASVRDIVLAGVAAGAGVLLAVEVLPKTGTEVKVLLTAAVYAAIRAMVAFVVSLLSSS